MAQIRTPTQMAQMAQMAATDATDAQMGSGVTGERSRNEATHMKKRPGIRDSGPLGKAFEGPNANDRCGIEDVRPLGIGYERQMRDAERISPSCDTRD